MSKKKLLTIFDLVEFCEKNKFSDFSSSNSGYSIAVQVPTTFESTEENSQDGLMRLKVRTSHTLKNRNGSYISEESAKEAMPSLKMRPVLAAIHQLDSGEWDFDSHNMEIIENDDGEEEINYIEKQVGAFTQEEPFLEYDEKNDKTYICAYAVIPEAYSKAASIIRRKGGTKVSCEILIDEFVYNSKERVLEIKKYRYEGVTLLGTHKNYDGSEEEVGEGMIGSRADIVDFSKENNSVFSHTKVNEKLIETLDNLNETLKQCFNKKNNQEGGTVKVDKLNELLEKYSIKKEDINFDYESMTDEELESKFVELFEDDGSDDTSTDVSEDVTEEESGEENNDPEVTEPEEDDNDEKEPEEDDQEDSSDDEEENPLSDDVDEKKKKYSIITDKGTYELEISLDEKKYALSSLVNETYFDSDNTYYCVDVYDSYLVMIDYWSNVAYKQSYKQDGHEFSLTGDRVQVYANWLTKEEEDSLKEMRSNYSQIKEKLNKYEKEEIDAQKNAIFEDESYQIYLETEEFKSLIENKDKYTVEELRDKAEIAFAKCVRSSGNFSLESKPKQKLNRYSLFSADRDESEKNPYPTLFANKTK